MFKALKYYYKLQYISQKDVNIEFFGLDKKN